MPIEASAERAVFVSSEEAEWELQVAQGADINVLKKMAQRTPAFMALPPRSVNVLSEVLAIAQAYLLQGNI